MTGLGDVQYLVYTQVLGISISSCSMITRFRLLVRIGGFWLICTLERGTGLSAWVDKG